MNKLIGITFVALLSISFAAQAKNCDVKLKNRVIGNFDTNSEKNFLVLDKTNLEKLPAVTCSSGLVPGYGNYPRVICEFGDFVPKAGNKEVSVLETKVKAIGLAALIVTMGDYEVVCF